MQTTSATLTVEANASHLFASAPADASPAGIEDPILTEARRHGQENKQAFAGSVSPLDAWRLFSTGHARLVDVRSAEELKFVGHVPQVLNVPWATGLSLNRNPRFVKELENKAGGKQAVILLLCRSGKRSAQAAEAATKAGFTSVFNVSEGFEGDLDPQHQRGALGGWRHWNLPWEQD
jgi:rhodanese-related sulfurtransferase